MLKRNQIKKLHRNRGSQRHLKECDFLAVLQTPKDHGLQVATVFLQSIFVLEHKGGGWTCGGPYYWPLNSMPVSSVKFINITSEVTISAMRVLPDGCS